MRFYRFLSALFLLFSLPIHSQFIVGWNGGYAFVPDLNKEIYIYNEINKSGLKKEMNLVHLNHGPALGARIGGDLFYEFLYSWKGASVTSKFDSANVPMVRQLKVYQYSFNFGFGFRANGWTIGASFDFGRFRGKGRRGTEANIKNIAFEKLWTDPNPFGLLSRIVPVHYTIFAEYKYKIFGFRPYVQFAAMKIDLGTLDYWLLGTYLNYGEFMQEKFVNCGMMVSIQIGKN
ncbi:MAG: hypothetical protein NT084_14225 [Bacteroidetes bacterium]|nr:hypothetical protein [Bacteroidota bacterium]